MNQSETPLIEILRPDGRELPENHHLEFRAEKNVWRMKVTIDAEGGRFVGKRIVIPLHTGDPEIAREIRDGIIVALSKAGILSRKVRLIDAEGGQGGDDSSNGPVSG